MGRELHKPSPGSDVLESVLFFFLFDFFILIMRWEHDLRILAICQDCPSPHQLHAPLAPPPPTPPRWALPRTCAYPSSRFPARSALVQSTMEHPVCTHPTSSQPASQSCWRIVYTEDSLCKSMLIKPGGVPVLPNSWKQSLRVKQHEEAEGYVLNKRTQWNSRTNLLKQTSNLLDKEFKEMAIKMLTKLRRMEEHSETFNKEVENIIKNQS